MEETSATNGPSQWKATVVFFSMDALGHIHPILSIVRELRRRKYRAIILTTRPLSSAGRLEALGFELEHCEQQLIDDNNKSRQHETDTSRTSEQALREIMKPLIENFRRGQAEAYASTYRLDGAVGKHLTDMIENHEIIEKKLLSLRPNLIVYDHVIGLPCATRVAPRWVRVYSGFPSALYSSLNDNCCAGLGLSLAQMTKEQKEFEFRVKGPVREKVRQFFEDHKCPDWPLELDLTPTSPYLNFYLGPQELGLENVKEFAKKLDDRWFRLEHTIDDDEQDKQQDLNLPQEFLELPGKLIYFSLGTLVTCDIDLINRLLKIFSQSENKFIVSMGQMHKHIKLYPNMWGQKFINQKAVLKEVDLFITHGGHNSIIEAFYYGVPGLIVLPVFADQFDSAQRVQDCGFGLRLNPFNCTQEELLEAISSVLSNNELRLSMQKISLRLRSIRYHEIAADKLVEQMVAHC